MYERTPEFLLYELVQLLTIFKRYRTLILVSLFVGAAAGGFGGFLNPPLETGFAHVLIGRVGTISKTFPNQSDYSGSIRQIDGNNYFGLEPGYRMLMTAEELYRTITVQYDHRRSRRGLIAPPFISELNTLEGEMLQIVAKGETKVQIEQYLKKIIKKIVIDHKKMFDGTVAPMQALRDTVEEIVKQWRESQTNGLGRSNKADGEKQGQSVAFFSAVDSLYSLDRALAPPNTYPTRIEGEVFFERTPSHQIWLFLVGGSVVGLVFGLVVAIVAEAMRKASGKH
jgi:hypothetical protein